MGATSETPLQNNSLATSISMIEIGPYSPRAATTTRAWGSRRSYAPFGSLARS
jgi:hypothetical protein